MPGNLNNLASYFLEFDENYYTELEQKFAVRKMDMPPNNSSQAMVVVGTKVILKDISKSVLKVIMMAKLEQVLNLD